MDVLVFLSLGAVYYVILCIILYYRCCSDCNWEYDLNGPLPESKLKSFTFQPVLNSN